MSTPAKLDPSGLSDSQLFAVGRLVHLRAEGWGNPFLPSWTVEEPLSVPPYSFEDVKANRKVFRTDIVESLERGGWVVRPTPGDGMTDEQARDQYAATDAAMEAIEEVRRELARRSGPLPEDVGSLLLLFDAAHWPEGFEDHLIVRAFEEPPSSLGIGEARLAYARLIDGNWLHYTSRGESSAAHWFPSPKCWARLPDVHKALEEICRSMEARRPSMRARLAERIAEMNELPEGDALRAALHALDRANFVDEHPFHQLTAYRNLPAPIARDGNGNHTTTTSAPAVCVTIAKALEPRPGDRVLVCGVKGGFTAALCSHLVGPKGRVVCIENREHVAEFARRALEKAGLGRRVEVRLVKDVTLGLEDVQGWDAVVVNGDLPKVPRPLIRQMVDGGRLLFFLNGTAFVVNKRGTAVERREMANFSFTKIEGEYGHDPDNWQENLDLLGQASHDVFVSYSSKDQAQCDALVASLEAAGVRCWYSARDRPVSRDGYEAAIMQAMQDAKVFLILLSHDSLSSHHVRNELTNATDLQKTRLGVRLPECPDRLPPNFQYHLVGYQQYDLGKQSHQDIVGATLKLLGQANAEGAPDGLPSAAGSGMGDSFEKYLEAVLADGRVTRNEMQFLIAEAISSGFATDAGEAMELVVRLARERHPDVVIE